MRPIRRKALVTSAVVVLIQAAVVAGLYFSGFVTEITRLLVISIFIAPIVLIGRDACRAPVYPGTFFLVMLCGALGYVAVRSCLAERLGLPVLAMAVAMMLWVAFMFSIDSSFEEERNEESAGRFFAILAVPQAIIAVVTAGYLFRF